MEFGWCSVLYGRRNNNKLIYCRFSALRQTKLVCLRISGVKSDRKFLWKHRIPNIDLQTRTQIHQDLGHSCGDTMHSVRILLFLLPSSKCLILSIYGRLWCLSHLLFKLSNFCAYHDDPDSAKGSHWWSFWRLCFDSGFRWSFNDIYLRSD